MPTSAPKTAKKPNKSAAPTSAPAKGLFALVTPDATLAAVIGPAPLPRTQLSKQVWDYIRKHGLQDKTNKQMVNADAKLKAVFNGQDRVTMFELTKLVSGHLSKA